MLEPKHKAILKKYIATHNGRPLDQKKMVEPNEMVKKVMIARLLSMTPEQQASLKQIVTPQTIGALNILMPGLAKMLERKQANGAG